MSTVPGRTDASGHARRAVERARARRPAVRSRSPNADSFPGTVFFAVSSSPTSTGAGGRELRARQSASAACTRSGFITAPPGGLSRVLGPPGRSLRPPRLSRASLYPLLPCRRLPRLGARAGPSLPCLQLEGRRLRGRRGSRHLRVSRRKPDHPACAHSDLATRESFMDTVASHVLPPSAVTRALSRRLGRASLGRRALPTAASAKARESRSLETRTRPSNPGVTSGHASILDSETRHS